MHLVKRVCPVSSAGFGFSSCDRSHKLLPHHFLDAA